MKICVIGGGTGSSAVLNGLKNFLEVELSVIVGMADDGGSNAVLRDEFGLLPLSDIRKSIIALSTLEDNATLREMFTYRFSEGNGLRGHTLGNLMMTALSKITGGEEQAVAKMSEIFSSKGKIIPVTFQCHKLVAEYDNGKKVVGEHLIDEPEEDVEGNIVDLKTDKKVKANKSAINAIKEADAIVIGPGDIYTTTLPNIIVEGIAKSIQETKAILIFVTNIMSKNGQTRHRTHSEITKEVERFIGRSFDYLIVNNERVPKEVLKTYRLSGEHLIKDDLKKDHTVIREELVANEIFEKDSGDDLVRSLVRHDSNKLGWVIYRLMKEIYFGKLK